MHCVYAFSIFVVTYNTYCPRSDICGYVQHILFPFGYLWLRATRIVPVRIFVVTYNTYCFRSDICGYVQHILFPFGYFLVTYNTLFPFRYVWLRTTHIVPFYIFVVSYTKLYSLVGYFMIWYIKLYSLLIFCDYAHRIVFSFWIFVA